MAIVARDSQLRILVLGYLIRGPLGGLAWHYLQYLTGLKRLGHDVYYLEDSEDYPSCYDPTTHQVSCDPSYGIKFASKILDKLGLGERWGYYDAHTQRWLGPLAENMDQLCSTADMLINVSGIVPMRPWFTQVPCRAMIDTDPAFEQIRQLTDKERQQHAAAHNCWFTFGENIPAGTSTLPDDRIPWQTTRQPVDLELWPSQPGRPDDRYTTVMQWTSYRNREFGGVVYGQKSDSFAPYFDLPARTSEPLELALGSETAPRDQLRAAGWHINDPLAVTKTPASYQQYLADSKGEFTVAKSGYVVSRCGWFSERSACYLATGRPVVTQDTGFSSILPTGRGLHAFSNPESACAALEAINSDYPAQCRAAREVASEYFDSQKVLAHLVERATAFRS